MTTSSKLHLLWLDPLDCNPPHGLDMHWKHDSEKVHLLVDASRNHGFDLTKPALVGYPKDGKIQLLSGTHRHEAAVIAGIKLPVTLWLRSYIEGSWGTELWEHIMKDIPVRTLMFRLSSDEDLYSKLHPPVSSDYLY